MPKVIFYNEYELVTGLFSKHNREGRIIFLNNEICEKITKLRVWTFGFSIKVSNIRISYNENKQLAENFDCSVKVELPEFLDIY